MAEKDLPDLSLVLEHPCPTCRAKPGEMCEGGAMPKAGVPHPARVSDYMASIAEGLRDRKASQEALDRPCEECGHLVADHTWSEWGPNSVCTERLPDENDGWYGVCPCVRRDVLDVAGGASGL